MSEKIRVGVIGCGGMATSHARRLESVLDRIDITALVDLDKQKAQDVADILPCDPVVETDYKAVLDKVDAVLVVLPHHLHHPVTIECLKAGKHVLLEKPMANTHEECVDIIKTAREMDRVLMVAYCMRFHPLVLKFKEYLDNKTYGDLFQLSIWTEQHTEREPESWICKADQVGGGQFFSHGCHYIDLMLWMMGKPVRGLHIGTNKCTPWMEKEGTSNVTIEFENGALGYHFGTWGARGTKLKYSFQAHCEKGMLEIDFAAGQLIYHGDAKAHVPGVHDDDQKTVVLFEGEHFKPTEVEMAHFIDCIETGQKPLTDGVSSLEGLDVIWKLYEAEENHTMADLHGYGLGTLKI